MCAKRLPLGTDPLATQDPLATIKPPTKPRGTGKCRWLAGTLSLLIVLALLPVSPASGQSTDLSDTELKQRKEALETELSDSKRERAQIQEQVLGQAQSVSLSEAELSQVEDTLQQVQALLVTQRHNLRSANLEIDKAEVAVNVAQQRVGDLKEQQHELTRRASELVVQTYIGRDASLEGSLGLARTGDIYEAARIQVLVGVIYGDLRTTADQLRAVTVDAEQAVWTFKAAVDRMEIRMQDAVDKEAELVSSVSLQYDSYIEVIDRYESTLYEAQILQEIDQQLADKVRRDADRLGKVVSEQARRKRVRLKAERRERERKEVERLKRKGIARAPTTNNVPARELRTARGIRVHESIYANLVALLAAAEDDGIHLRGGGYRSAGSQVALRRYHCGTSNYAIYEKSSSKCRPPTARPGFSMHERGLAVDFTVNGRAIPSRNTAAFRWLSRNAAKYGFRNLASEPWHWSTNGR